MCQTVEISKIFDFVKCLWNGIPNLACDKVEPSHSVALYNTIVVEFIYIDRRFNHYKWEYKRSRYRKFIYIRKGSDTLVSYQFYSNELHWLEIEDGFFDGWPNPPNKDKHRGIMEKSYKCLVAIDEKSNKIIGFINAISDGVLAAYIPLLEVLPQYQNQGIGSELVERMLLMFAKIKLRS